MSLDAINGIGGAGGIGGGAGTSGVQRVSGQANIPAQGGKVDAISSTGINTTDRFSASQELQDEAGSVGGAQQAAQAGATAQTQTQGQGQGGGQDIKAALQTLASSKSDKVRALAQQALDNGPDKAQGNQGATGSQGATGGKASADKGKEAIDQLTSLSEQDTKDLSEDEQKALGVLQSGKQGQGQAQQAQDGQALGIGTDMAAQATRTS